MMRARIMSGFGIAVVWLAILPAAAWAAEPGPPPGIPAAPQDSELAQARAEREARDRATSAAGGEVDASRTTAWQKAVDQADGPHLDELAGPRTLAALIGSAWFVLAARSQWRARRRARA